MNDMNEVIVNTNKIESVWEKDSVCFVKMTSGKVWICDEYKDVKLGKVGICDYGMSIKTIQYIKENKGLICLPLSYKGKSDNNG